jgi:hypothetical protein
MAHGIHEIWVFFLHEDISESLLHNNFYVNLRWLLLTGHLIPQVSKHIGIAANNSAMEEPTSL